MTDRKDLHNLNNGSINLRVCQVPYVDVKKFNGGIDFNPLDLESDDEEIVLKARNTIKKIMQYVNSTCDAALDRNIKTKNYKCLSQNSTSSSTSMSQSIFNKNKRVKLTYK